MTVYIPWDRYEVALLFNAYERIAAGADVNVEAEALSETLRGLARRRGVSIDDTFRNVNGMKMQLANVQYLFAEGRKGLSGASAMIRRMFEIYKTDRSEYQTILEEALRMTGNTAMSVEDAFFAYAKGEIGLPPKTLAEYLQKAADYCRLKRPLLGMTDVKTVQNVQQKIAESRLLRLRFGRDAQSIRNVTQLYCSFITSRQENREEPAYAALYDAAGDWTTESVPVILPEKTDVLDERVEAMERSVEQSENAGALATNQFQVDFSQDSTYFFTRPISYTYKGKNYPARSWNRIYVEICGLLFSDHRDAFMSIMNGDIPGYNSLAFADAQNYRRMRAPKCFAPGYYLESNMDATSIVRKLRGLHELFAVGEDLQIVYRRLEEYQPKRHSESGSASEISIDNSYDWDRPGLFLVDLTREASYAFTQPEAYEYNGVTRRVSTWGRLYADLCGLLFEDYHDAFMNIMNGDIPGRNALAFADEKHKSGMRVARCFAPGFYLESNIDATTIVRRIRGLYQFFGVRKLRISCTKVGATKSLETKAEANDREKFQTVIAEETAAYLEYRQKENEPTDTTPWEQYEAVLKQAFQKGFQKESGLDMKKLRKRWEEICGEALTDSDEAVRLKMAAHCVDTGKRWYLAELLLNENDRKIVLQYIDRILSSGKSVLYYSSIYAALEHELESTVLTENLLTSYLRDTCQGRYILRESFLTNDQCAKVDLAEEIKNVMRAHGRPIHTDELKRALHHLPPDQVERALHIHPEFIMDAVHVYFHESMADLTDEELRQIAAFIQAELDEQGYMIGDQIQRKLGRLYPETAERLSFLTPLGVRGAVAYKLREYFAFSGPVITPKGKAMNMQEVFAMYCQRHAPFTLDELAAFARECGSTIYLETVHQHCTRVSENEFVPNGVVHWNIPHVDAAIALHCLGKYVPLKSVQYFDAFPLVGYPWNNFLLEQYVATVSKDFMLMHSSYAKNAASGAIVRRDAGFESFDEVLADALANAPVVLEDKPCLEYLAKTGYITRKKLSNINEIITRAKMLRSQKG